MADMATTELAAETGKETGNPKRARALRVLGGVVVIAALLAGLYWAIFPAAGWRPTTPMWAATPHW